MREDMRNLGGIRPARSMGIRPDRDLPSEGAEPWKRSYAILFGGASVALVALRAGDAASALAALEQAFGNLPGASAPPPVPPPGPAHGLPERF